MRKGTRDAQNRGRAKFFDKRNIQERLEGGAFFFDFFADVELDDVRLAVNGAEKVEHFGRLGGIVPEPEEIVKALKEKL